jgi:hypothetical protein
MKKVLSFVAIAAITMFVASCGNGEAEAKRKADSAHMADSLAQIESTRKADSARVADSTAKAWSDAEMKRKADSAHMADSMAKLKPGKKPANPTKTENKKATGGRG